MIRTSFDSGRLRPADCNQTAFTNTFRRRTNNTGAKWRDLPSEFGKWRTVYGWFDLWNNDGTLQAIVDRLTRFVIENGELAEDLWCVDGTILRAHRCAAGGGKKGIPKNRMITL